MAETIDEISMNYEEDGVVVVKELDKEILTRGAWTTILFKFQQWDWKKEEYGKVQYSIRRYRKMSGEFRQQSKFNISSDKQAGQIVEALTRWLQASEVQES